MLPTLRRTESLLPQELTATMNAEKTLDDYAAKHCTNVPIEDRLTIPEYLKIYLEQWEMDFVKDELLCMGPFAFNKLKEQDIKAAWVFKTRQLAMIHCLQCCTESASLLGHGTKGCGMSHADAVTAYGAQAHKLLNLPAVSDEEMKILLMGLSTVVDFKAEDITLQAKLIGRRVSKVDFNNSDVPELDGSILHSPITLQARLYAFHHLFPRGEAAAMQGYINFMNKFHCTGCRAHWLEYKPKNPDDWMPIHTCYGPWESVVERFANDIIKTLRPYVVKVDDWNDLLAIGRE